VIDGGAGNDVIFGNQGQDDIVGGNSDMFSLATPDLRTDAPNMIFGGSGTAIARIDAGATGDSAHSHDADAIVANNGDIVRVVATGGARAATGFLAFAYDSRTRGNRGHRDRQVLHPALLSHQRRPAHQLTSCAGQFLWQLSARCPRCSADGHASTPSRRDSAR